MPKSDTILFAVGKTYRLHSSQDLPNFLGGTIKVIAELSPRDQWGNRILLVDMDVDGEPPMLGVRCFVEEGVAEVVGVYGARTIPVEVATAQGVYPRSAKAYANAAVPTVSGGFTAIRTLSRVSA